MITEWESWQEAYTLRAVVVSPTCSVRPAVIFVPTSQSLRSPYHPFWISPLWCGPVTYDALNWYLFSQRSLCNKPN